MAKREKKVVALASARKFSIESSSYTKFFENFDPPKTSRNDIKVIYYCTNHQFENFLHLLQHVKVNSL